MKKEELEHRDLLAGTIATSLAKEGYFGQEVGVYGFFSQQEEKTIFIYSDNEEICAHKAYEECMEGNTVTELYYLTERFFFSSVQEKFSEETAMSNLVDKICLEKTGNKNYLKIKLENNNTTTKLRELSGFGAWNDENATWNIYINAFFPTTFSKWLYMKKEKIKVTSIFTETFDLNTYIYDAKKEFEEIVNKKIIQMEYK